MAAYVLNPSTQEAEAGDLYELKASLVYKRIARAVTQRRGHQFVFNIASILRFSQGGFELVDENEDMRQRTKVTPALLLYTHY